MNRLLSSFLGILALSSTTLAQGSLDSGLVAYWPFNGNALDATGNGNNGIVFGAILAPDRHGSPDRAYVFDGVDDYIDIGPNVKPPFPFTVSVWIKPKAIGGTAGGIFRNDIWDPGSFYHGAYIAHGLIPGTVATGVGGGLASPLTRRQAATDSSIITAGEWHHVVVIFAGPNNQRHIIDTVDYPVSYGGEGVSMTYSGARGAIGHRVEYANGAIDDVRVYNRVLTMQDIKALYGLTPVSVTDKTHQTPSGPALSQNYPNPFNPSTTFSFSIPLTTFVTLKVVNILGQDIATVVNDQLPAGHHTRSFDASGLPNGVYVYELTTNGFRQARKMLIVR